MPRLPARRSRRCLFREMSAGPELLVRCTARLGESICWHPVRSTLGWVDILDGKVFEFDDGRVTEWKVGQMVGAVVPAADGTYLAALRDGIHRFLPVDGTLRRIVPAPYDSIAFRFNDGKVDPCGRFWVGTLSLRGEERTSVLYCLEPAGQIRPVLEGVSISNGLAWTADGRILYYIDTLTRAVRRFAFDAERGTISDEGVAVTYGKEEGFPDGCAIDCEGNLWVAHWEGGRITQSDPGSGRRLRSVELPVRNVTSCTFGGPRFEQLFVSTAKCDGVDEELAGSVFVLEPGVAGSPCHLAAGET